MSGDTHIERLIFSLQATLVIIVCTVLIPPWGKQNAILTSGGYQCRPQVRRTSAGRAVWAIFMSLIGPISFMTVVFICIAPFAIFVWMQNRFGAVTHSVSDAGYHFTLCQAFISSRIGRFICKSEYIFHLYNNTILYQFTIQFKPMEKSTNVHPKT